MKLKKGDTVIVTAGKDRGKSGKVIRAFPKKSMVLVEGVSVVTKHKKSNRRGSQGQVITKPMPIQAANVAFAGKGGKPVRIGYVIEGKGKEAKKTRVQRPNGEKV
jgi:large subunit ribosomal protein L24